MRIKSVLFASSYKYCVDRYLCCRPFRRCQFSSASEVCWSSVAEDDESSSLNQGRHRY